MTVPQTQTPLFRFGCVPFTGTKDGERFFVNAESKPKAVELAKIKSKELNFNSVLVETKTGLKVYEGPNE